MTMTTHKAELAAVAVLVALSHGGVADPVERVLEATGVRGGLVVHLGCDDGVLATGLAAKGPFVVHCLVADPASVGKVREDVHSAGLYGRVSVARLRDPQLPYVDNLVNLLVVSSDCGIPREEMFRVLAPNGLLCRLEASGTDPQITTKPPPDGLDDWTHFLHGPDNNAVANDTVVGPPRHMQWLAGPTWTRDHHSAKGTYPAIRGVVSVAGRLYYLVDETPSSDMRTPSTWFLTARDAFSGILLWKKQIDATTYGRHLEEVWRGLVADASSVYVSLGTEQPLSRVDGATGDVIQTYAGSEGCHEVVTVDGRLFLTGAAGQLLAFATETGERLWEWRSNDGDQIVRTTLAASDGRVYVKTEEGVACFAADTGAVLWQRGLPGPVKKSRLRYPHERLIVSGDVVLVSYGGNDPLSLNRDLHEFLGSHPRVREYGGKLAALSTSDGRTLWEAQYLPGLESMPGEIYVIDGTVWLGPEFDEPRDLRTGTATRPAQRVIDRLWTHGHHYRCYPGKATSRFIITAKRGIELIDIAGENHSRNNWVRGTCRVGVTPCNGLLYAPPHSCGCYMEAKLFGFWALAAQRQQRTRSAPSPRIERGPAYNPQSAPGIRQSAAWSTYRGNNARGGSTVAELQPKLEQLWTTELRGRLSAPTVADGTVLVAQVDGHTVHALDAATGKRRWRFTAGGRIDSPPTIHKGLALFGSRDGWVYCLRASDGQLAWRFRVAPQELHSVAYEQLESLWPVSGNVLVVDGIAYVAAGRSSYLDGGITLCALAPETGEMLFERRLADEHVGALSPPEDANAMASKISQNWPDYKTFLAPDKSDSFSMNGALTDILSADGSDIFMRHTRFDRELLPRPGKRPHLFATGALLDGYEHNRSYWVLGTADFSRIPVAYPWILPKRIAVPYGLMMAFDDTTVWCVRRGGGKKKGKPTGPAYVLCATPRPDPEAAENAVPDFQNRVSPTADERGWQTALPLRPRAMLHAGSVVAVGGSHAGGNGGLVLLSTADGHTVAERGMASSPVWDGMAAANGCLYASLTDGVVACFGSPGGRGAAFPHD